jgi:translation initiation factor IF-3
MAENFLVVNKTNLDYLTEKKGIKDVRLSPSNEVAENGIFPIKTLLFKANELGLDFVIINQKTNPVIGKILDYKKFLYLQKKTEKEQMKKNKANAIKIKEVKFHLNIGKNDYDYKTNHIKEFIEDGYKVKCQIFLRGREREFKDIADEMTKQIIDSCLEFSQIIEKPSSQGNTINFAFIKGKD